MLYLDRAEILNLGYASSSQGGGKISNLLIIFYLGVQYLNSKRLRIAGIHYLSVETKKIFTRLVDYTRLFKAVKHSS
jgi:hypothetical protein